MVAAVEGLGLLVVVAMQYPLQLQSSGPLAPPRDLLAYATALLGAIVSWPTAFAVLVLLALFIGLRVASRRSR